jgi:NAD(P)-dependent dehydrogenase (short-subunit alcohol dehydrogenase family)
MQDFNPGESGKTMALVTGAAKRIGLKIAERLALAGFGVILHCREESRIEAEAAVARLKSAGGIAFVLCADLAESQALGALIAQAQTFGPLRLLINSAAIFEQDGPKDFSPELLEKHLSINLRAPLILSRDFARQMPEGVEGAIINIIDQRVLRLTPQFFSYNLAKSALWTATQTMAQAFAPQKIRVNAIGPGPVLPNMNHGLEGFKGEVLGVPLQRAVELDEIADAVLYLAKARNVTGQMIAVDAGQHLAWQTPDIIL